ncbi:hypothetical protein D3C76_349210 [compost metagenome]
MTRVVICQDGARNTTGCGNGHLQDGDGEAIRSDCQARMATGHPNGMGRGNSKGKDRVKDCREHGSSGTGRDDLRGRQMPSPFLYMHSSESAHPGGNLPMSRSCCLSWHKKHRTPLVDNCWPQLSKPISITLGRKAERLRPPPETLLHHFFIHRAVKSVEWTTICPSLCFICTRAKSVAECPWKPRETG